MTASTASAFVCPKCDSDQRMLWKLNRHIKRCRPENSAYIRKAVGEDYTCQLCSTKFKASKDFKAHIFFEHNEMDVSTKYSRTIQKLIGVQYLARFRS